MLPTDLASFTAMLQQHRDIVYALMFGIASAHAMLYVLFAGYMANAGALDPVKLAVVCCAGSFAGDALRFGIARVLGISWLAGYPRIVAVLDKIGRLAERNQVWMVLTHRYPHGIRGAAAFAYGISRMTWSTFLTLNLVAAAIWAVAIVGAGYAFGRVSEQVLQQSASQVGAVMLLAFLVIAWVMSRRLDETIDRK